MEFGISNDSAPGFFTVHHKIKWSVKRRLIWRIQKQYQVESNVKKALTSVIGRDFNESPPTIGGYEKISVNKILL